MSLLREAEKCIANQKSHAALNALITALQPSGQWREQVKDADLRTERGKLLNRYISLDFIGTDCVFLCSLRDTQIQGRRSVDCYQR